MDSSAPVLSPQVFTVLVVEDSPTEQKLITTLFQQRGHRVVVAHNGAGALLSLALERPDVVVSDGVMPILDGYQLCRLIKDDPATRDIPVILLTGQAVGLSRFWARTCGADRFLLKGRELTQVVEVALELLASHPGAAPSKDGVAKVDFQELREEAIQVRLGKALEHQLLETAMRDAIGHLDTLQRDSTDLAMKALELLHELVLPGAIHLIIKGEHGPAGLGLFGSAVGPQERAAIEEAAHWSHGQTAPWSSTWEARPPLKEAITELADAAIVSLPVGIPSNPVSAWMTLYVGRQAFRAYERLFEVACHELGRLLDLAESRRQHSLTEDALRQAQKMASLAQMADGISHDVNNLFQTILASLQVAELSVQDERGQKALVRGMQAAWKGAELGTRMRECSGRMWCVKTPLDLNALVREFAEMHPTYSLALKLTGEHPWIEGDRNQLNQVLSHLFTNAAEALDSGSGLITVTTAVFQDAPPGETSQGRWFTAIPSGRTVRLSIEDHGQGIPDEVQDQMFDPFFSTRSNLFGRGLGLPVTLGILKAHGAALQVSSTVREGTTIQIWFPLAEPRNAPRPSPLTDL